MQKAIVLLAIVAALLTLALPAYSVELARLSTVKPQSLTGEEVIPNAIYNPSSPGLITSPGDTVGFTQYDYQSNGSTGNRIVVDALGNVHVVWMNGNPFPSTRQIYYNCFSSGNWVWPANGQPVSYRSGDGYTQLDVTLDDRSVIAYHNAGAGRESLFVAVDFSNCLGTFNYYHPPNRSGGTYYLWPYLAVASNGAYHITMTRNASPDTILYARSNNGGTTWTAIQRVGVANALSGIVVASPVSNKVLIAYTADRHDNLVDTTSELFYVQSLDGTTWDFAHPVNVTRYGTDQDSLGVGWDIDAVYDYNDNLHLMWVGRWQSTAGIYYLTHLFHWNSATGTITDIAQTDSLWPSSGCDFGNYGWHFSKTSLAVNPTPGSNLIYAIYTDFDTSDCALSGYANGDIYMHSSNDNGTTWSPAINITNTHTPGCIGGDCESDNWPSMAEKADGSLHITYINDKDAGAIPMTQGSVTDNPVLYLRYPVTGIDDDGTVPNQFSLAQNYPNPFNAQTSIAFELASASHVTIEIFDILGRKVTTLVNENRPAGPQQVTWNAGDQPSGIYSYRIKAGDFTQSKKMLLVK